MRALVITSYGSTDSALEFKDIAAPSKDLKSNEVYIKVHAASINPVDWKIAAGQLKRLSPLKFPAGIGYDVSGIVAAVGTGVAKFNPGDQVISRIAIAGAFQEYVVTTEDLVALKPKNVSLEESAGIPLAAQTAVQCLEEANYENKSFKTAFVPAGLGGVGSYATQILRNVYGTKVATTVSTSKVEKMRNLVPDADIIDYKVQDYTTILKDIDFVLDTTGDLSNEAKIVKRGSDVRSVATIPSLRNVERKFGKQGLVARCYLTLVFKWQSSYFTRRGANYDHLWLDSSGSRLSQIVSWIEEDKVKVITDEIFKWSDAKHAFNKAVKGGVTGKIIVRVAD